MKNRWLKGAGIGIGAMILSTLGMYASDTLQGIDGGFSQLAGIRSTKMCDEDSAPLKVDGTVICADLYEASPSEKCLHKTLANNISSEQNANIQGCHAVSVPGVLPWNFISLPQAQRMCASAGKRLPTSEEWYRIALGVNSDQCVITNNSVVKTGNQDCLSAVGVFDTIGNVWEWVDEQVMNNVFDGRELPSEGYVTSVDTNGIALSSGENPDEMYGSDYIWSKTEEGVYGMIRGGFYGSREDAGLYTINTTVPTAFATQGIGFRCVKDILQP